MPVEGLLSKRGQMNISKLSSTELRALLKRIPVELNKRARQEKSRLLKEIAQIAAKRGFSLKELVGKASRPVKSTKKRARKPVAVKYRHPQDTNLTWTGRGRKPRWVIEWLAKGKTMKNLAV